MRSYKPSSRTSTNSTEQILTIMEQLNNLSEELLTVRALYEKTLPSQASALYRLFYTDPVTSSLTKLSMKEQKLRSEITKKQSQLGLYAKSLKKTPEDLKKLSQKPNTYSNMARFILAKYEYDDRINKEYQKKVNKHCMTHFIHDIRIEQRGYAPEVKEPKPPCF